MCTWHWGRAMHRSICRALSVSKNQRKSCWQSISFNLPFCHSIVHLADLLARQCLPLSVVEKESGRLRVWILCCSSSLVMASSRWQRPWHIALVRVLHLTLLRGLGFTQAHADESCWRIETRTAECADVQCNDSPFAYGSLASLVLPSCSHTLPENSSSYKSTQQSDMRQIRLWHWKLYTSTSTISISAINSSASEESNCRKREPNSQI